MTKPCGKSMKPRLGLSLWILRLPGMNGLQLTQKIKKTFANVDIAIMTGYDLPEYKQAAIRYLARIIFFVKESLPWDAVKSLVESLEKAGPVVSGNKTIGTGPADYMRSEERVKCGVKPFFL